MCVSAAAVSPDTSTAHGQPDVEPYFEDAAIEQSYNSVRPLVTAHFPDSLWLSDAHWLDDHTLLVSSRVQAINIWSVAVELWPEAVGVLVAPALLWLLFRLLRRSWGQWHLTPGELHCRGCHYQLTGLVDPDRCPECGARLTPHHVVLGHDAPFKSLAAVAMLIVVLGVVYFGFGQAIPRYGWASRVFRWPSTRAMNWAVAASSIGFIRRHSTALARVEAVDARTGAVTRRVVNRLMFNRGGEEIGEPRFAILPDHGSILLMGRQDLLELSLENGSLRRRLTAVDGSDPCVRLRDVIVDPQGRYACAILSTRESIRIDLTTGARQAPVSLQGVPGWPEIPIAILTEPPMVVSVRPRISPSDGVNLELFDLSTGEGLITLPASDQLDGRVSTDGDTVWLFYDPSPPDRLRHDAVSCKFAAWRPGETTIDPIAEVPFDLPPAQSIASDGQLAALVIQGSVAVAGSASIFIGGPTSPGSANYSSSVVLDLRTGRVVAGLNGSSSNALGPCLAFSPRDTHLATWATGDLLAASRATGNCTVTFFSLESVKLDPVEIQPDPGRPIDQK